MTKGSVYFIECAGRIKIGFSTDVKKRMWQIATSAPSTLTLIGSVEGTYQLEHAVQKHLRPHRAKGEWFVDCDAVRAVIDAIISHGPSSIGFLEQERQSGRQPSPVQVAITDLVKRSRPAGKPAWEVVSELAGVKERAAKHRLANRSSYTIDDVRALVRSEDGFDYLKAIMADKRPSWYADLLAAAAKVKVGTTYAGRGR